MTATSAQRAIFRNIFPWLRTLVAVPRVRQPLSARELDLSLPKSLDSETWEFRWTRSPREFDLWKPIPALRLTVLRLSNHRFLTSHCYPHTSILRPDKPRAPIGAAVYEHFRAQTAPVSFICTRLSPKQVHSEAHTSRTPKPLKTQKSGLPAPLPRRAFSRSGKSPVAFW
jgi:hypothetical protein